MRRVTVSVARFVACGMCNRERPVYPGRSQSGFLPLPPARDGGVHLAHSAVVVDAPFGCLKPGCWLGIGGDTGFSKVRKQGPNRLLVVSWDCKIRGVGLIGANSGVVTAQAGSSIQSKYHTGDIAARGPWARPMAPHCPFLCLSLCAGGPRGSWWCVLMPGP